MLKNWKRMTALMVAMLLMVGQLAVPASAADDVQAAPGVVDVPTLPGGETTEQVDVEITVTTGADGNVTATAVTPAGGDVTDSGSSVNYESETVTDAAGEMISGESEYDVVSADGCYSASGGSEVTTGTQFTGDLTLDLMEDGTAVADPSAGNSAAGAETTTGDLKADDAANFDQTTTEIVTDRTAEAEVKVEMTAVPNFVDADGNPVDVKTSDALNYYYGEIYDINNENINDSGKGWSVGSASFYKVTTDAEGNTKEEWYDGEGVCQRVVYDNNGTPDDKSDDKVVNGLYCVDLSTGINQAFDYRMVNLEDAVEEGYYSEEDVAHLRAIMTHGYTWNDDEDNGATNLENIKNMVKTVREDENTSPEIVELLNRIDLEKLTREQAATATGMAIWRFGNRVKLEDNQTLKGKSNDANIQALYDYLISLKEEPKETEVFTEDKFIDNMSMTIGDKTEGATENQNDNHDDDVYDVGIKFSLVVVPDPINDDLLVSVVDGSGIIVKTVRIAGSNKENENYEYAQSETGADGKEYYKIDGLQLQENTDNVFNIKLDGTQQLEEGVYVFESEKLTLQQAVNKTFEYWTGDENWESEKKWAAKELGIPVEQMTKELYKENVMKFYFSSSKYKNEDGSYNWDYTMGSQNFIGKAKGTAEVSANMNVTVNFNVDESKTVTTHLWRVEGDPRPAETPHGGGTPRIGRRGLNPTNPADGTLTILDEEVPLAAAPATGDASILFALCGLASTAGYLALGAKKKED